MASGNYYPMYPARILFETYGFKKVTKEEQHDIVERLRRNTNSTQVYEDDKWRYRQRIVCPPSEVVPVKRFGSLRSLCPKTSLAVTKEDAEQLQQRRRQQELNRSMDSRRVDHIFRRLYRNSTQATELRYLPQEETAMGRSSRPQSAASRLEETLTYEEQRIERLKLHRLCRPTTATQLKVRAQCLCCVKKEEKGTRITNSMACNICRPPNLTVGQRPPTPPEEDFEDAGSSASSEDSAPPAAAPPPPPAVPLTPHEHQSQLINRLLTPTYASQGGLPLCGKAPPDTADWMTGLVRRPFSCRRKIRRNPRNRPKSAPAPAPAPIRHIYS